MNLENESRQWNQLVLNLTLLGMKDIMLLLLKWVTLWNRKVQPWRRFRPNEKHRAGRWDQ